MKELKERAMKGAARYLSMKGLDIVDRDYKKDGLFGAIDFVADDAGELVFVTVSVSTMADGAGFRESPLSREQAELLAANWVDGHSDDFEPGFSFRFDHISLLICSDDRAVLRHATNVLGSFGSAW